MNCNPFTKGHAYLIQKARESVEFLFVFIVEEDLSDFSFADRITIARENCKGFNNVKVLPSGKYMISRATFGEYFTKESLQNQEVNPAKDVNIFGRHIAPCLRIKYRFAGEKPMDTVTRQYNLVMKEVLPSYGINFVEIPRCKTVDGRTINATHVRKLLREDKLSECQDYLTSETFQYIKKNFSRIQKRLRERN